MNKKLFLTSILAMGIILPTMALGGGGAALDELGAHDKPVPTGPDGPEPEEQPQLGPCLVSYRTFDQGMYYKGDGMSITGYPMGTEQTCRSGYYCPGATICPGGVDEGINSCPANYDNIATGLTSIEECCLGGYNSSTGLCNDGGVFPSSGLMQANTRYIGAATSTNMDGVYSGNVNAVAEYDLINYVLNAGQYLPADSETPTTCPAGSYCSGIGTVQYNATANQGIETCPSGFGSSAAGASSANECYRTCSGNVTIEHATGVTGNDYYGTGVDTCVPTGCVNGWHLKSGVNGTAIATAIGNEAGINSAYISGTGTFSETDANFQPGNKGQAYYGISDNMSWAVEYGSNKGMLIGQARCSTQEGTNSYSWTNPTIKSTLTDETGQNGATYCYCNVTGYKNASGALQSLSSSWVFSVEDDASVCAGSCPYNCASIMSGSAALAFRAALLGTIESYTASCEANTITINWKDVDAATAGQNDEGTATYGGDVRTPFKAATKPGKRFLGWIFSKPTEEN